MRIRTYSELVSLPTFEERYKFLQLSGSVGEPTFGFNRFINQQFYGRSKEWKAVRDFVIIRDNGCDLGIPGHEIPGRILIHHMNPISEEDIAQCSEFLLDPEYLICVSHMTHQAIHYGDENLLVHAPVERKRNDTCPWRKEE